MNRRVQMTKELIRRSFFELLEQKPINKITISELCKKADINRSTFYKYYGSQYDVLKDMEKEAIDKINDLLVHKPGTNNLILLLEFLKRHKDEIKIFFECNLDRDMPKQILSLQCILDRIQEICPKENYKYLENYILFGSIATIRDWLDHNCQESVESIASAITKIVNKLIH